MEKSYKNKNDQSLKYKAYENDFTTLGEFESTEEDADEDAVLLATKWPGYWDGSKWLDTGNSDDDSYEILIIYRNQNFIELRFESRSSKIHILPSYHFMKEVAKKYFLMNGLFEDESWTLGNLDSFEKVETAIKKRIHTHNNTGLTGITVGQSWTKIVRLIEAKEIFDELKIKVEWPTLKRDFLFIADSPYALFSQRLLYIECTGTNKNHDDFYKKWYLEFTVKDQVAGNIKIVDYKDITDRMSQRNIFDFRRLSWNIESSLSSWLDRALGLEIIDSDTHKKIVEKLKI